MILQSSLLTITPADAPYTIRGVQENTACM